MAASALLALLVMGYMAWQAVTAPAGGSPQARVVAVEGTLDGERFVEVAVRNEAASGLREVIVSVECDEPPPQLTFANVPAEGERRGFVRCPAGAEEPRVAITSFTRT